MLAGKTPEANSDVSAYMNKAENLHSAKTSTNKLETFLKGVRHLIFSFLPEARAKQAMLARGT